MSSGSEKRARTSHLTIRLTTLERQYIDSAADRTGLTTGSYARQAVMGAPMPRQVRRPPVERKELARLLGEIGKIGSNLNQLTRAANNGLLVYTGEIDAALGGLRDVRDAIMVALGRDP
jgi:hypothetical protein